MKIKDLSGIAMVKRITFGHTVGKQITALIRTRFSTRFLIGKAC